MVDDPFDFAELYGPEAITDDVYFVSMFSTVTAFDTADGLFLVDSGLEQVAPVIANALRGKTDAPVDTAIYTHGHTDHAFGLDAFIDDENPRVIAHENTMRRFRRYERTAEHNQTINSRQFAGVPSSDMIDVDTFGMPDHPPDTLYDDSITVSVGDLTFEINHGRGETDDHSWIYCEERDVLCPGDFFVSSSPNAGNPQKVQRYPGEWAAELREMASRQPRHMCPGHGEPVIDDPDRIQEMLTVTADYLDAIVESTLDALNDGSPPHVDIVHAVERPDVDADWLDQIYDEIEFVVRNILRRYGGWWSGRPSELKPAPRDELALEIAALAGDAHALVDRAQELFDAGDERLACHLADFALEASPEDPEIQEAVSELYEARSDAEEGLMSSNIYKSAAYYADNGRPFR
jgi:glyoxylase-like metal-dependent hydrolase (beta-lactamase superfamily II)